MKTRDLTVYVAGGMLAGAVIAWSAMRVAKPVPAATPASVESVATTSPLSQPAAPRPSAPPSAMTPAPVPVESAASPSPLSPPAESLESVPRISLNDFNRRLEAGEIAVIDVRDVGEYSVAHIPGAIHIPLSFIQGELPYLPRGKPIVTYCT